MKNLRFSLFASLAISPAINAATMLTLSSSDLVIQESQLNAPAAGYLTNSGIGTVGVGGSLGNNRRDSNRIYGFTLPTLNIGESISSVTFSVTQNKNKADNPTFNVDLFGLGTSNPDSSGTTLYYDGDAVTENGDGNTNTKLFDNLTSNQNSTPSDPLTVSNAAILLFINNLYAGNTPIQTEVFFRLNNDVVLDPFQGGAPNVDMTSPTLEFTVIPEPSSALLLLGGMGCLFILRRR